MSALLVCSSVHFACYTVDTLQGAFLLVLSPDSLVLLS